MAPPHRPGDGGLRTLLLVGDAALAGELRARLPDHWHVALVTMAAGTNSVSGLTVHIGDGTSALVLERAGVAEARVLIAALGDVQANLEVCRLARQRFDVAQVHAVVETAANGAAFRELGVEPVVVGAAMATALRNRLERASVALDGVGLGEGEILQISVHPSSPAIGRPLRSFSPQQWTIAAVFRGGELIIPHGDTVLEAQDSILLIGQPHVLPAVGEYLRVGRTQFPLPYGIQLIAVADGVPNAPLLRELEALALAANLNHVPVHVIATGEVTPPAATGSDASFIWQRHDPPFRDVVLELLSRRETGCLCLLRQPAGRHHRRWPRSMTLRHVLQRTSRPVFLPAGAGSYDRVLLPIAPEFGGHHAAEVAFDLSDMLNVPLTVLTLQPPQWLRVAEGGIATDWIQQLADIRRRHAVIVAVEGNPMRQLLQQVKRHDLLVLGSVPGRRGGPFRPDAIRYVADRLPCSAIVVPEYTP